MTMEVAFLDQLGQVMRQGDRVTGWWDGVEYTGVIQSFTCSRPTLEEVGLTILRDDDGTLVESVTDQVIRDDSDLVPPWVEKQEGDAVARWHEGQRVQVVECVDATRKPKEGGKVYKAEVLSVAGPYVIAHIPEIGETATFWVLSGWTAWDAMFRWRLMPPEEGGG